MFIYVPFSTLSFSNNTPICLLIDSPSRPPADPSTSPSSWAELSAGPQMQMAFGLLGVAGGCWDDYYNSDYGSFPKIPCV